MLQVRDEFDALVTKNKKLKKQLDAAKKEMRAAEFFLLYEKIENAASKVLGLPCDVSCIDPHWDIPEITFTWEDSYDANNQVDITFDAHEIDDLDNAVAKRLEAKRQAELEEKRRKEEEQTKKQKATDEKQYAEYLRLKEIYG